MHKRNNKVYLIKFLWLLLLTIQVIKPENAFKTNIIADCNCNDIDNEKDYASGKTFYSIRPQDSNTVRRISKFVPTLFYNDRYFLNKGSCMNLCVEFQKSFNSFSPKLAEWFLFNNKKCLTIGDSNPKEIFDVNAQQFGMVIPENKPGKFCLNPKIENIIADVGLSFDLQHLLNNLWTKIHFIAAQSKTNLNLTTCGAGEKGNFPDGLFSTDCSPTPIPYTSIACALSANKVEEDFPALNFGKIPNYCLKKGGLAAIHWDLGYDILRRERGHIGLSLHTVFPTGNKPESVFLFEPIVGPNKSWQIGFGLNGSYDIYSCNNSRISFYLDTILTHLFKSNQTRLFNLKKNGPWSQYLLLKKFDAIGNAIGVDRVANILAGNAKIGADVMFDGSLMFQFSENNFFINLGYNLWARTKEKMNCNVSLINFSPNTYGLKGNLFLSKCINMGCPTSPDTCPLTGPCGVIEKTTLSEPINTTASNSTISLSAPEDDETTFINIDDVNFGSALHPTAISNKFFASIGNGYELCNIPFYWLIGGECELGNGNKAIDQWGVFGKVSVSF